MPTTRPDAGASALELLPLPKIDLLADLQMRGVTCVWCGTSLTPQNARDLGPRPRPGGEARWFPRGCTRCVRTTARRVLTLHSETCSRCAPGRWCNDRASLRLLAFEGRP
jgi:hypothetical protein